MAEFRLTKKEVEDLGGIWNYTCENWSEKKADVYYQLLVGSFKEIACSRTIVLKLSTILTVWGSADT
jgi:plasmid stabilization system protein ParE